MIPRSNFNRRLEPAAGILHGAGQSPEAFAAYVAAVWPYRPCIYMTYIGMKENIPAYFEQLNAQLRPYSSGLIPQIGLGMTTDGKPEEHYEHRVAAGEYDEQIEQLWQGVRNLNRLAFVRIGYEFSGHWNGYLPESYRQAWQRVVTRQRQMDVGQIASVWCYAPDSRDKDYMAYYPGDEWVDWWGIDLFSPGHFSAPDTLAFMSDARAHRFPVMIGESTPRRVGVLDGQASWEVWFALYFDFIEAQSHLKAFCYINWDWAGYPQWSDWGDCRLEMNPHVLASYRRRLSNPLYLHLHE